ncbi:MAG: GIY-YIG nuclease family protein [Gammaproteobacteria bacterium]|nr:GIY-YIG nuclease family protein [Gammaproteobacteria bacterium]
MPVSSNWLVYILRCKDGTLYTGITNHLAQRLATHAAGRGAKYLRGRLPVQLVYVESGHTRPSASQREAHLKRLPRAQKVRLIHEFNLLRETGDDCTTLQNAS